MSHILWKEEPDEHNYPAAASYLLLVTNAHPVEGVVAALRTAPREQFKAKDILRASRLELLPADDRQIANDIKKAKQGRGLSPVLLVRGDLSRGLPLQIADGYHRVCASYRLDETEQGGVDERRWQAEEPGRDHASGSRTLNRPPASLASATISPPALRASRSASARPSPAPRGV